MVPEEAIDLAAGTRDAPVEDSGHPGRETQDDGVRVSMPPGGARAAMELLRALRHGDSADQRDTWALLVRALGKERQSSRELLPWRG